MLGSKGTFAPSYDVRIASLLRNSLAASGLRPPSAATSCPILASGLRPPSAATSCPIPTILPPFVLSWCFRTTTHSCRGAPTPVPSTAGKLAWRSCFWRCNHNNLQERILSNREQYPDLQKKEMVFGYREMEKRLFIFQSGCYDGRRITL